MLGLLSVAVLAEGGAERQYIDGRPAVRHRIEARDHGVVLRHGDSFDAHGARDVVVWEHGGRYFMHYDGAGPTGWLLALAVSDDLIHWKKRGTVLDLGAPGELDSGAACYGVPVKQDDTWHLFYVATPNTTPPPERIPAVPYQEMKARSHSPAGPWVKQPDVVPFRCKPGTYYSDTASPGAIVHHGGQYLQFFCAAVQSSPTTYKRTIGIARTRDLNGTWKVDAEPILPLEEQVENSALYYQPQDKTWFLFTNHVGIDPQGGEYTDAIWVYWSKDLNRWNPKDKAVVLDGSNCTWSKRVIGLPSVIRVGDRLAIFYDGVAGESTSHVGRDVGLAWLDLPIKLPPAE